MSTKPITDFVAGFLAKQEERERLAQEKRASECETIITGYKDVMTSALGAEALAALKPEWEMQKCPGHVLKYNYAQVILHYKGELFTLKDAPGQLVEKVRETVARIILEVDEEQRERVAAHAKLAATLQMRPLPDHVTSSWWNRIQHIVGDNAGLLADWDAAMVIFDARLQEAKAQEKKRRQEALDVSREFMLEILAEIEDCGDKRRVHILRDDIPPIILHDDRRAIQEAAFERLQELDREYERQQEALKERILKLERASFWPFYFYEVHYQTGIFYEEGHPGVETDVLRSYSHECTQDGWWVAADGGRVQLPFVSKVVERVVCSPDDFWPRGMREMWKVGKDDDGLKYRVPSLLAVRADVDACAQAKEV